MRNYYSKKCRKNIDNRTRLLNILGTIKYSEDPETFKEILSEVEKLSKRFDELKEIRIKYY
jgi:hypothetical protein